jgi:hypothetical protein
MERKINGNIIADGSSIGSSGDDSCGFFVQRSAVQTWHESDAVS